MNHSDHKHHEQQKAPKETYWGVFVNALGFSWKSVVEYFRTLFEFLKSPSTFIQDKIGGAKLYLHPFKFFIASCTSAILFNFILHYYKGEPVPSDSVAQYLGMMQTLHGEHPSAEIQEQIAIGVKRLTWIDSHSIGTKTGNLLAFFFSLAMTLALIPIIKLFSRSRSTKELLFYNGYLSSLGMLLTLTGQFIGFFFLPFEWGGLVGNLCFVVGFIFLPMCMFYSFVRTSERWNVGRALLFGGSYLIAWAIGAVLLSLTIDFYLSSGLTHIEKYL